MATLSAGDGGQAQQAGREMPRADYIQNHARLDRTPHPAWRPCRRRAAAPPTPRAYTDGHKLAFMTVGMSVEAGTLDNDNTMIAAKPPAGRLM